MSVLDLAPSPPPTRAALLELIEELKDELRQLQGAPPPLHPPPRPSPPPRAPPVPAAPAPVVHRNTVSWHIIGPLVGVCGALMLLVVLLLCCFRHQSVAFLRRWSRLNRIGATAPISSTKPGADSSSRCKAMEIRPAAADLAEISMDSLDEQARHHERQRLRDKLVVSSTACPPTISTDHLAAPPPQAAGGLQSVLDTSGRMSPPADPGPIDVDEAVSSRPPPHHPSD